MDVLLDAINDGETSGWSAQLLETWRKAYSETALQPSGLAKRGSLGYPSYAKKTYEEDRKRVQPYDPSKYYSPNGPSSRDETDPLKFRALAYYDAFMISNVLNKAEFWPYITGVVAMPAASQDIVDREIFAGPFGRYTTNAPWSDSTPPPITPRGHNITSIRVRAWDDVDGLQVKYGESWGDFFGSSDGGAEHVVTLAVDEYIASVNVGWGYKAGHCSQLKA